jgi:glucoamylase
MWSRNPTVLSGGCAVLVGAALLTGIGTPNALADAAPGGPGQQPAWAPANKDGFGTAKDPASKVWYTLHNGGLSEVYYPDLGTPSVRDLQFIVSDGHSFAERESDATAHTTRLADPKALVYTQVNTEKSGRWRITKTYVTDPRRATVLMDVDFQSLTGRPYQLYALYNPRLSNGPSGKLDDSGRSQGDGLTARDSTMGSALVASPGFTETSTGYLGSSDGWQDLRGDYTMNWHYAATNGNIVQTGHTTLTGVGHKRRLTLALGFGGTDGAALTTARTSLAAGFPAVAGAYARGWHDYVRGLKKPPAGLRTPAERNIYHSSVMVLAALEDKTYHGAFVASPTMPWAWGTNSGLENPSGAYHLVWARDLYEKASGLMADGDRAAAERALSYLFERQQKSDGSFPQNSTVDGTPHWTSTQLDEVADPVVLAWQLGRRDAGTWSHVKRAADYIVGNGPQTQQERWENQGGYSPATIGAEIAGLVCAADIAKANGDTVSQQKYLATADEWHSKIKGWTVTTNGPYNPKPYFLRITKDGNANAGTKYTIGDSGPDNVDQRSIVDPSFLELVRLGVLAPDDPAVTNSIKVVDDQLGENTPNGRFWHRYTFDGYGEQRDGGDWNIGFPPGSQTTRGRLWPLFAGERGEYEIAAGKNADARLAAMAATANQGGLLAEQVWDNSAPAGQPGFMPGTPTLSAMPLGWAHGQYLRLAWSINAGESIGTPSVVACRYAWAQPATQGRPAASSAATGSGSALVRHHCRR